MASLRGWSLSGRAARGAPTAPPPGQPSELLPPLRQAPDLESGGGGGRGQEDGAGGRGDDARAGWARLGIPHPQTPHYEQQLFRTYRGFMGMFMVMLLMGMLPPAVLIWAALAAIFLATLLRVYLWRQLTAAVAGLDLHALAGLTQPTAADGFLVATLGEGTAPLDLLNLRLSLVDRDFDEADYELLLALDQSRGAAPTRAAVTDGHLAALPTHVHGAGKPRVRRQLEGRGKWGGDAEEGSTCSVCLDDITEGAKHARMIGAGLLNVLTCGSPPPKPSRSEGRPGLPMRACSPIQWSTGRLYASEVRGGRDGK
eukprot:jgi/Tetstr1/441378/TSEL_029627.t1